MIKKYLEFLKNDFNTAINKSDYFLFSKLKLESHKKIKV